MNTIAFIEEKLKNPSVTACIGFSSTRNSTKKFYFVELKNKYRSSKEKFYFSEEEYAQMNDVVEKYKKIHKDELEKKKLAQKIKRDARRLAAQKESSGETTEQALGEDDEEIEEVIVTDKAEAVEDDETKEFIEDYKESLRPQEDDPLDDDEKTLDS